MSEKLRKRLEEETARDQSRLRAWAHRRQEKLLRTQEESPLPAFCRLCFAGMIIAAAAGAAGDLMLLLRHPQGTDLNAAFRNASLSALIGWALFGVPFAVGAAVQLTRGFSDPWFARHSLTFRGRPRMEPRRRYRLQLIAAVSGLVLLALLAAAARFLC